MYLIIFNSGQMCESTGGAYIGPPITEVKYEIDEDTLTPEQIAQIKADPTNTALIDSLLHQSLA